MSLRPSDPLGETRHVPAFIAGRLECPLCAAAARGRAVYKGHYHYQPTRYRPHWREIMAISKQTGQQWDNIQLLRPQAGVLETTAPLVWEYMVENVWAEGGSRQTSTLLIFVEDGMLKLMLNDRALRRTLWVSTDDLMTGLHAMNEALVGGTADWRRSRFPARK